MVMVVARGGGDVLYCECTDVEFLVGWTDWMWRVGSS